MSILRTKLNLLVTLPLLITSLQAKSISTQPDLETVKVIQASLTVPARPVPNWDKEVLDPLRVEQEKEAEEARAEAARIAEEARLAALAVQQAKVVYTAPVQVSGGLTGSYGYAIGGNCVNEIPFGLRGVGNPINWAATTQAPYIGGAALWYYNHTARIVGLWSNGDIEVAQQGWYGPPITRFPRSTFRGFR